MVRKVQSETPRFSNAPIAAWRPTLIHRFVRSLKRQCVYLLFSVSRKEKMRDVNFPSLREKGCTLAEEREHLRIAERMRSPVFVIFFFFFLLFPTGFITQSFSFPRGLDVDVCLAGSERVNEKCNDRRIIYRRCNLNNPRYIARLRSGQLFQARSQD